MFELRPIGQIMTPYAKIADCPRNIDPDGPSCEILVNEELAEGLEGLQVGQQVLILYWLEHADRKALKQHSRRTGELSGVFALRTPHRCNPLGAAVLPIRSMDGNRLTVSGLDCLNGTPLIDIKPAMSGEK